MSDVTGETVPVVLGGRTFEVPRLPLGVSMFVYPVCQRLTNAGLVEQLAGRAPLEVSLEQMGDLTEIAFHLAHTADESLDTEAFLKLPVTPAELYAAFFVARIQCGGWRPVAEDRDAPGEEPGATPPTSTSTASSPS